MIHRYVGLALLLWTASGCHRSFVCPEGRDCSRIPESCREPADACVFGLSEAHCPGDSEPFLACREDSGGCKVFVGGCIEGWTPSPCPLEDLCCFVGEEESTPFAPGAFSPADDYATSTMAYDIALLQSRFPISARVDPGLVLGDPRRAVCSAGSSFQVCTWSQLYDLELRGSPTDMGILVQWMPGGIGGGTFVRLEVDHSTDARAYTGYSTDVGGGGQLCTEEVIGFASAELTLSSAEIGLGTHGHLALTLASGEDVELWF